MLPVFCSLAAFFVDRFEKLWLNIYDTPGKSVKTQVGFRPAALTNTCSSVVSCCICQLCDAHEMAVSWLCCFQCTCERKLAPLYLGKHGTFLFWTSTFLKREPFVSIISPGLSLSIATLLGYTTDVPLKRACEDFQLTRQKRPRWTWYLNNKESIFDSVIEKF